MIFQKSFSDLLLKKHFLKSMLKTIVKINIFVETMIQCFVLFSQKVQKNNLKYFVTNVFTVTFDQFNAESLLKTKIKPLLIYSFLTRKPN